MVVHRYEGPEVEGFAIVTEDVLGEQTLVFRDRKRTLIELLDASLSYGDREYLVQGDVRWNFSDHHAAVRSVAAALAADYGITKGDRVAIAAANRPEYVIAFWAAVHLGAIAVTMNAWWSGPELRDALADCEPVLLIADADRLERIGNIALPVIRVEDEFEKLLQGGEPPDVDIAEDDPAVILYTSGTTGKQKGATHSHRNLLGLVQIQAWITASRLPAGMQPPASRIYTTSPLFHVSGLHSGVVASVGMGTTIIWPPGRFDPAETIRILVEEKCTRWSTVPTAIWRVMDHPDAVTADWSALGHIGGGGMAWSPALQKRMFEVFGDTLAPGIGYGLTESTAIATTASADLLRAHPETVGPPLPTVEVEVREDGEVYIRGPLIMLGYWNQPEATAATILPGRWLKTGDLGHFEDGLLYLSSRRYDLILRAGENVYPAEIEGVLEAHPSVSECTVVGTEHPQLGHEVCAVIVPAPGGVDVSELSSFVAQRLAKFKVPSRWEIWSEPLPRTETGKVIRAEVLAALG